MVDPHTAQPYRRPRLSIQTDLDDDGSSDDGSHEDGPPPPPRPQPAAPRRRPWWLAGLLLGVAALAAQQDALWEAATLAFTQPTNLTYCPAPPV